MECLCIFRSIQDFTFVSCQCWMFGTNMFSIVMNCSPQCTYAGQIIEYGYHISGHTNRTHCEYEVLCWPGRFSIISNYVRYSKHVRPNRTVAFPNCIRYEPYARSRICSGKRIGRASNKTSNNVCWRTDKSKGLPAIVPFEIQLPCITISPGAPSIPTHSRDSSYLSTSVSVCVCVLIQFIHLASA